jgi:CHAT domain-containing protein
LFGVPFAALVAEHKGGRTVYLVDNNSVQIVPGALLLSEPMEAAGIPASGRFLGVADPIYNQADPRWLGRRASGSPDPDTGQLQRLAGSAREIAESAEVWQAGSGTTEVLTGAAASLPAFRRALKTRPAVVHLATHVVPAETLDRSLIAFSLISEPAEKSGLRLGPATTLRPEYLTTAEIGNLDARRALVVMTGCASGEGEAHPGAGLLGLTHAWLAAGADAVLATAWPVEDDTFGEFSSFYRYLRVASTAEALRRMQAELAHAEVPESRDPRRWASFQLTGVVH